MDNTEKANKLIEANECILLDRIAWGKDYRATILIPPPHGDLVQRDTEPARDGVEDYTLYQSVMDMVEGVFAEANKRSLPDTTPVVFRGGVVIYGIRPLSVMPQMIKDARKHFAVKA